MIVAGSYCHGRDATNVAAASTGSLQRHPASWFLVPLLLLTFPGQAATCAPLHSAARCKECRMARAFAYTSTGDLSIRQNHHPLVSSLT